MIVRKSSVTHSLQCGRGLNLSKDLLNSQGLLANRIDLDLSSTSLV